jgi:hypothetical protein
VDDEAEILNELKQLGEAEVRHRLATNQFSLAYHPSALRWIEELDRAADEESERRKDASQAEQTEIARSAKDAAWAAARAAEKANIRATMALIIAAISIAATVVGIFIVHRDSTFKINIGNQIRTEIPPYELAPSKLGVPYDHPSRADVSGRSLLPHEPPRGISPNHPGEAQPYQHQSA